MNGTDWYGETWPHRSWKPSGEPDTRGRGRRSKLDLGRSTCDDHSRYVKGCLACRRRRRDYQRGYKVRASRVS